MPCCKLCNSIQTASIIGRIIVAFSAIGIVIGFLRMVITLITGAIFQAVMAGILIFGAQHRNRTALLFWMFMTILELIVSTTFLALVLIVLIDPDFLRYVLFPYVLLVYFRPSVVEYYYFLAFDFLILLNSATFISVLNVKKH